LRRLATVGLLLCIAPPLQAQDDVPANLVPIELERSRTCVDALTRLEDLDVELAPLAIRAQRLLAIAGAIRLEESTIVDSLDATDPLEAAVRSWFETDAALAQRYLTQQDPALQDQRTAARAAIQESVTQALEEVQAQADSVMIPTGSLRDDAAACSNVILVRGAAIEACNGLSSRVCQAARDSTIQSPFRFIAGANLLWYRQEFRPWTAPGPIQVTPQGQLTGARTIGSTRVGNIAINLSLNPMLRQRSEMRPEDLAIIDSINTPLGIESTHPDVVFTPALAVQANLPHPIGDETRYVVHFGPPEEPDVIWSGDADTGAPFAGTVALAPEHVTGLAEGFPVTFTAIKEGDGNNPEVVYSIELTSVNQVPQVRRLIAYMGQQLSADLQRLIPPRPPEDANP